MPQRERQLLGTVSSTNALWSMGFMSDTLYGGRRFRTFNVLDEGVHEGLVIEVDTSPRAERMIQMVEQLKELHGCRGRFTATMAWHTPP